MHRRKTGRFSWGLNGRCFQILCAARFSFTVLIKCIAQGDFMVHNLNMETSLGYVEAARTAKTQTKHAVISVNVGGTVMTLCIPSLAPFSLSYQT